MKKKNLYSYKPWLILSVVVISMVLIAFSSGNAADLESESIGFEQWTPVGYKEVTVEKPSGSTDITASPQEGCVLVTNDMVSHWPLDDQVGATNFLDVVNSFNGTCEGDSCPVRTIGKVGGAFNFVSGDSDVINVPADSGAAQTAYDNMANGSFSVGIWVKTSQFCQHSEEQNNKVFVGRYRKTTGHGTWWVGCTEPGGVAVFRLRDSSDIARQINGTTQITDNKWHYIVGVRDASADKNYLYVDGQLEGILELPDYNPAADFNSDEDITMGAYNEPQNYYFNGTIDEVVLYDKDLLGSEITNYYNACKTEDTFLPFVVR